MPTSTITRRALLAVACVGSRSPFWRYSPWASQPPTRPRRVALHPARVWNDLALDSVRIKNASDAEAARLYAMVNVAMYDAVNALSPVPARRTPALVEAGADVSGDPAAAAGAAHDVLASLYPDLAPRCDDQLTADLAAATAPASAARGRAWGGHVAGEVVAARQEDGSTPIETLAGGQGAGVFPQAWKGERSSVSFDPSPSPIRAPT